MAITPTDQVGLLEEKVHAVQGAVLSSAGDDGSIVRCCC